MRVSVVGLGKLGLCLAGVFARRGVHTIGVDINGRVVNAVNSGECPVIEPGLEEIIADCAGSTLVATEDHRQAVAESDITFILTATPSNPDGTFSNRYVESAVRSVAEAYRDLKKRDHIFVISSTVKPGSTTQRLIPMIEEISGRRLNIDFAMCYNPDFVALGDVVKGFMAPDLIIIGQSNDAAGACLERLHQRVCINEPKIFRMSIPSAEIAKVSLNAYITVKISFANVLGNICENVPDADVDAVTNALGADRRISPHYFRAGLAYGGTCFPRDTWAFAAICKELGVVADMITATEAVNDFQHEHLYESVIKQCQAARAKSVAILGLAFKPRTPVIVESSGVRLIEKLLGTELAIIAYDPLAMENVQALFEDRVTYAGSPLECFQNAEVCVLVNPEPNFRVAAEQYRESKPLVIIDCWRTLNPAALSPSIRYIGLSRYEEVLVPEIASVAQYA
jgi:UDPglucose 6-dehydrogenase